MRESLPKGIALLHDPALNKETAFTASERDALRLRVLLPPRVFSQEEQLCARGLAGTAEPGEELLAFVRSRMYEPRYADYLASVPRPRDRRDGQRRDAPRG